MTTWALIAVNARARCKTRLAETLDAATRLRLVRAMLAHVIATVRACPEVGRVAIVSPERDEAPAACLHIRDDGLDLNKALQAAAEQAQGQGASRLLVLPADLPRLAPADVSALLDAGRGAAIAPDMAGAGTNALALPLPLPTRFGFSFGPDSFALHRQACGDGAVVVRRPGFADLDQAGELHLLQGCGWAETLGPPPLWCSTTAGSPGRRAAATQGGSS